MGAHNLNPNRVKVHRTYDTRELADLFGVHKNTVRQWQRDGLKPIDRSRPTLFQGEDTRAFLSHRNASRKRPCPPGTIYCFRCRAARTPAGAMADYIPMTSVAGNLQAICATCETIMHRRIRWDEVPSKMPGVDVQVTQAAPRLVGGPPPSLNSDLERQAPA